MNNRLPVLGKSILVFLLLATFPGLSVARGQDSSKEFLIPKREWQNVEGRKISAPVVRIDGTTVVFWIKEKEIAYAIERLSSADQEVIKRFQQGPSSEVIGDKIRFLCIRANFSDRKIFPQNSNEWKSKLDDLFEFAEPYYRDQSYGQIASMPHSVTDVFMIDKSWESFKGKESELAAEMRKRAEDSGWMLSDFDHVVLSFPPIDGNYGALGTPGTIWMPGDNPWPPGFAHELGHAFGVGHAGTWEGGSVSWPAIHDEGSDANFTMGSGEVGAAWNLPMKFKVGWVPPESVEVVSAGTKKQYRLYQFDVPQLTKLGSVGLRAGDFWISYAPNQSHWVKQGVSRRFAEEGVFLHTLHGDLTRAIDATPDSRMNPDRAGARLDPFHDTKDAAVVMGTELVIAGTNAHPNFSLVVKPVQTGKAKSVRWIDVEVEYNTSEIAGILAEDAFANPSNVIVRQSEETGWASAWESNSGGGSFKVVSQGLAYDQLRSSGGAMQLISPQEEKETLVLTRKMRRMLGGAGSSVWIAFLFQAQDNQVGDLLLQFGDNAELSIGKPWGAHFGIYTTHSQVPVQTNKTHLVVARLDFQEAETIGHLWVDPKIGHEEPLDAEANAVHRASFRFTDTLKVVLQGYGHGKYIVDELKIGTSYQVVLPSSTP